MPKKRLDAALIYLKYWLEPFCFYAMLKDLKEWSVKGSGL